MSAIKEHFHDQIEAEMRLFHLSEIEIKIFRLNDDIRILKEHLYYEEHPDKYSLKKSLEKRQEHIAYIQSRISAKEHKLKILGNKQKCTKSN